MSTLKKAILDETAMSETKAEVIRVPVKVHERLIEIAQENEVGIFSVFRTFIKRGLEELEKDEEFRETALSFDNSRSKSDIETTKKRYNFSQSLYDDLMNVIKEYRIMNKGKFIVYCLTEGIKEYDKD